MSDINFNCPSCGNHLEVDESGAGLTVPCPECSQPIIIPTPPKPVQRHPVAPNNTKYSEPSFPIIINSSPRALHTRLVWFAIVWIPIFIALIIYSVIAIAHSNFIGPVMMWIITLFTFSIFAFRLWLQYLHIKNTQFRIYPNKIDSTSYTFKFMGAENNTVNLTQLRQIQCYRNSMLDVWFFACGWISITVSGDASDFKLSDIYQPEKVRRQIEEIVFGKNTSGDSNNTSTVAASST